MLIVFEGIDGSGKSTQFQMFCDALTRAGRKFTPLKFPRYEEKSATLIKMYLNGEFGGADAVNAFAASSFYAVDRYASFKSEWGDAYTRGELLIFDRYSGSNAIHQGAKMGSDTEREAYLRWLEEYEFKLLGLPKPDLTLYFRITPEISERRLTARGGERDIHELDSDYTRRCAESADFAANYFNWTTIDASGNADAIHKEVMHYAGFSV